MVDIQTILSASGFACATGLTWSALGRDRAPPGAWASRDGKGFSFKLNLLPVGEADIVVHEIQPEADAEGGAQRCSSSKLSILENGRRQAAVNDPKANAGFAELIGVS
jgi:hypothetical protein